MVELVKVFGSAAAGIAVKSFLERRPRVLVFYGSRGTHELSPPGQPSIKLNAHNVIVRNSGTKTAENVRVPHISVATHHVHPPSANYSISTNSSGVTELLFPKLVPGEEVVVSYLYPTSSFAGQISSLPVRHDEALAEALDSIVQPVLKPWQSIGAHSMFWLGVVAAAYLSASAAIWLAGRLSG
jgi:hypothetical protein